MTDNEILNNKVKTIGTIVYEVNEFIYANDITLMEDEDKFFTNVAMQCRSHYINYFQRYKKYPDAYIGDFDFIEYATYNNDSSVASIAISIEYITYILNLYEVVIFDNDGNAIIRDNEKNEFTDNLYSNLRLYTYNNIVIPKINIKLW